MSQNYPSVVESSEKKTEVRAMFNAIAGRYDLLNRVLSAGIDQRWRRRAVALLAAERPKRILDIATGTADLALLATSLQPEKVIGLDISAEMLAVGREKAARHASGELVELIEGDAEAMPFEDNSFDAILVAFGVRNFGDLGGGLREMNRVLRPGGSAVVLEFSQPTAVPIKQLYGFYSKHILPRIGGAISGDSGAYKYLPDSVAAFPYGDAFLKRMAEAGFASGVCERLTFGIASLYKAQAS